MTVMCALERQVSGKRTVHMKGVVVQSNHNWYLVVDIGYTYL